MSLPVGEKISSACGNRSHQRARRAAFFSRNRSHPIHASQTYCGIGLRPLEERVKGAVLELFFLLLLQLVLANTQDTLRYSTYTVACSFKPNAFTTLSTVANSGFPSLESAL